MTLATDKEEATTMIETGSATPRCTCEWADDTGDLEVGPDPYVVEYEETCPRHGRDAQPEAWALVDGGHDVVSEDGLQRWAQDWLAWVRKAVDEKHGQRPVGLRQLRAPEAQPETQTCRGCGTEFPWSEEADFCPRCAAENAGITNYAIERR